MSRRSPVLKAMIATVLVGGLWAAPALAAQVTGSDPEVTAAVTVDARADGLELMGPGLLGLDATTVEQVDRVDPGLAARVSSGLRSADPYVIETTIDDVAAQVVAAQATSQGRDVALHGSQHGAYVIVNFDRAYVIAVKFGSQRPAGSALLAQGLEREQLVSAIHTALSKD